MVASVVAQRDVPALRKRRGPQGAFSATVPRYKATMYSTTMARWAAHTAPTKRAMGPKRRAPYRPTATAMRAPIP